MRYGLPQRVSKPGDFRFGRNGQYFRIIEGDDSEWEGDLQPDVGEDSEFPLYDEKGQRLPDQGGGSKRATPASRRTYFGITELPISSKRRDIPGWEAYEAEREQRQARRMRRKQPAEDVAHDNEAGGNTANATGGGGGGGADGTQGPGTAGTAGTYW